MSAVNLSELLFQNFEYIIDSISIQCNGEDHKIEPIQLTNLYIEKDYDTDHLPIILIQLVMADELYYDICKNRDNTTFTIVLKSQISISEREKASGSIYISDKFITLDRDNTPFQSKKTYDAIKEKSSSGVNSTLTNFTNTRTFVLGRKSDLVATKKVTNIVLSSANMLDAVSVTLSQAGASNVLMSPMDNNTSYSELILLPQPTVPQLKYLNSFYGFYKEGAQIFFDLDCTYIIRNTAKCTAFRKNEIKTVYFCAYDLSESKTTSVGSKSYINEQTAYIGLSGNDMIVDDLSSSSNEYVGTNSVIINNDGNITQAKSGNGNTFNILSVRNHNNFYTDELALRMKEMSCVVTLKVTNIDLSLITPNKTFKILSTDTDVAQSVSGSFRLVSIKTFFNKDGDRLIATSIITLKRTDT